jgi:fatty acid-binding protein DegV
MYAEKIVELIEEGNDFDQVVFKVEEYAKERNTIFALASFSNLVKNGRVSKLSGFIAGKLGIWGIGVASDIGTIIVKTKTRGIGKVLGAFITDMKENGFAGGYVIISHCQNLELAEKLREKIVELWNNTKVKILSTGGLCSYYAERRGLIVSY